MARKELYIEQKFNNRFIRALHLVEGNSRTLIGSSKLADVLMMGRNVAGIHACIDFRDGAWIIADLGSDSGTWINGEAIVEYVVNGNCQVKIGDYELNVMVAEKDNELFTRSVLASNYNVHQVVVERHGAVEYTKFVEQNTPYEFSFGGKTHSLGAPKDGNWVQHEFGKYVVKQRLSFLPDALPKPKPSWRDLFNEENRYSMWGTIGFVIILGIALFVFAPKDRKVAENQFQRMIYDGKMMSKLKEQAGQLRKQKMAAAASAAGGAAKQVAKQTEVEAPKVVKTIRAAGLTDLIGRISKRASNSVLMSKTLTRMGTVAAGGSGSTRNIASVGEVNGDGNAGHAGKGSGDLGGQVGVGTKGVGGGRGVAGLVGMGTLAKGNVGAANVGIIEEETDVDGGLDREIIAEYIRGQLGQIRYCYERQLSGSPDLHGKVLVKFTIGSSGEVTSQGIGLSTLGSAMVEGCILRRVAQWKFPSPKGGTSVVVSYPFLFKSTN